MAKNQKKDSGKRHITVLDFPNLQLAWQGMNEYLFVAEDEIVENNAGGAMGSQMVCLDTIIIARKAEVDADYDFGEKLGYSKMKWTTLVNNYVNYHYLDMLRNEITRREKQKANLYNYSFHFSNNYGSGKDCLISLTLSRRANRDKPFASFVIRTSEITKRLLFDFTLVQRIIEYLYGHNDVEVQVYAQNWYITAESFIMYNNTVPIMKLYKKHIKPKGKLQKFQAKILEKYKEYMNHPDPHSVMFRVNRRSMLQIQKDENGKPLSGVKSMKASELTLKVLENFPPDAITINEIRKYKKSLQ